MQHISTFPQSESSEPSRLCVSLQPLQCMQHQAWTGECVCVCVCLRSGGWGSCSSLAFTVLRGSVGRVAHHVREARPPEQRGSGGDDKEAVQGGRVAGHAAMRPVLRGAQDPGTRPADGTGGAAPAVPPKGRSAAGWGGDTGTNVGLSFSRCSQVCFIFFMCWRKISLHIHFICFMYLYL